MGIEDRTYMQRKFNPPQNQSKVHKKSGTKLIIGFIGIILAIILLIQWLS